MDVEAMTDDRNAARPHERGDLRAELEAEHRFAREIVASRAADLTPASYRRVAEQIEAGSAGFQREDGAVWSGAAVARLLREEALCIDVLARRAKSVLWRDCMGLPDDETLTALGTGGVVIERRVALLQRFRDLDGTTLHFTFDGGQRRSHRGTVSYIDPILVPHFDGEAAWFELERVQSKPWPYWRAVREVDGTRADTSAADRGRSMFEDDGAA